MIIISSADLNWGIGKDDRLLERIPEDMKRFKEKTLGGVVIMGRKTMMSLPGAKPLKDRINIVITKQNDFKKEGFIVCRSINEAIASARSFTGRAVFVIGGGSIYRALLPYSDTAFITRIYREYPADTFIENFDLNPEWELCERSGRRTYKETEFEYLLYKRK